jgi:hypothetical protein
MRSKAASCALVVVLLATSAASLAANLSTPQTVQVTALSGLKSQTKGYIAFTTSVKVAGCEDGFWVPVSDASFAAYSELANSALVQKSQLVVAGDRDQLLPDTAERTCRLTQLR